MKMKYVVFFLVFFYVKVSGELVCSQLEGGIVGGNSSIICHSPSAIKYFMVSKLDGHRRTTVTTVSDSGAQFFFNDSKGMNYRQRIKASGDMKKGSKTITWVPTRPGDVGLYEVLYKTEQDIVDQKSYVNMTLFFPPTLSGCRNLTVMEGDDGSLACNVSGSEPITITWKKDNKTWNGKNLSFINVKRYDQGSFNVEAKNRIENETFTDSKRLHVLVIYKPEGSEMRVSTITSSEYYEIGDMIEIHCMAVASPPADYALYVNGHDFTQDNRTLGLFKVKLQLIGNNTLKCVPFNKAGVGKAQLLSIFVQDHSREDPPNSKASLEVVLPVVFVPVAALIAAAVGILCWTRRRRRRNCRCCFVTSTSQLLQVVSS